MHKSVAHTPHWCRASSRAPGGTCWHSCENRRGFPRILLVKYLQHTKDRASTNLALSLPLSLRPPVCCCMTLCSAHWCMREQTLGGRHCIPPLAFFLPPLQCACKNSWALWARPLSPLKFFTTGPLNVECIIIMIIIRSSMSKPASQHNQSAWSGAFS